MIKQFFIGIFFGVIALLLLLPHDPWAKQQAGNLVFKIMAGTFNCDVSGEVESFSLLQPTMVINNFSMRSRSAQHAWSWQARKYITGFSWLYFVITGAVDMWVELEQPAMQSALDQNGFAIMPHIQDLMKGPNLPIPLFVKEVVMRNGRFNCDDRMRLAVSWHGQARRIGTVFKSKFSIIDGNLSLHDQVARSMRATIDIDADQKNGILKNKIAMQGRYELPQLGEYPTCFFSGRWHGDNGRLTLHSVDQSLRVFPLIIRQTKNNFSIDANIAAPVHLIQKLSASSLPAISGDALLQLRGSLAANGTTRADIICEDLSCQGLDTKGVLKASVTRNGFDFAGNWQLMLAAANSWGGQIEWKNFDANLRLTGENKSDLRINGYPFWMAQSKAISVAMLYDQPADSMRCDINGVAQHEISGQTLSLDGCANLQISKKHLSCFGSCGDYFFSANGSPAESLLFSVKAKSGHELMQTNYCAKQSRYEGVIDLVLFRNIYSALLGKDLQAGGSLAFWGELLPDNAAFTYIKLQDGTIRLPQTLNFLNSASGKCEWDFKRKTCVVKDLACGLHTGSALIKQARIELDAQNKLSFVHVPITVEHCLFTIKHDLYAMLSAGLLLSKVGNAPLALKGHVILDRSQLKENLFSPSMQKAVLQSFDSHKELSDIPIKCDITVETKDPIRVDTQFLQANAHVDLHIQGSPTDPKMSGSVSVPSGTIGFPYRPLAISKGEITFLNEQPLNPIIELMAKNRIKNHTINLHVSGSLQDHMVLLEATPPLSEEQIVSLLLTGAHEESLQAVLPSLLMQNVTNYIFSSHQSTFYDRFIKPWLKQVNVQLIPDFNQQLGRGGLRGALEFVVNERWRALIEKNFTLTEDTRFELEYILSDDVTFRVVRDERRDVGFEVEMKWKF